METVIHRKSTFYYYFGAFLVTFALVLFIAICTLEAFMGGNETSYQIFISIASAACFSAAMGVTRSWLKKGRAENLEYLLTGVLRFVTSSVMLGYAYTKLHNGHMYMSYAALDTRLNDLSDFDTVWSFYGRYSSLQVLLGFFELVPAVMLLFRRTAFLGAVFMVPVVANVVLLNVYYHIGGLTLPVSALVLVFTLYILYSYKAQILEFLSKVKNIGPPPTKERSRTGRFLRAMRFFPLAFLSLLMVLMLFKRNNEKDRPVGAYELVTAAGNLREPADERGLFQKIYFEKRRLQSTVMDKKGIEGAQIDFPGGDSIVIMYRRGALDTYVKPDTTGAFFGTYSIKGEELTLVGKQGGANVTINYKRLPLREFEYWWH